MSSPLLPHVQNRCFCVLSSGLMFSQQTVALGSEQPPDSKQFSFHEEAFMPGFGFPGDDS